ncbi:MAG TPA: biopolymer transporter ExbD [Rariglobus sp.]|jgi:biopolymer transport protein ExbD|nr:biopolymer transporter ExbD [Rariglobus sp.]
MSRHRRRRHSPEGSPDLGFQIAPMIDVVFVVLVFFMSLCAAIKVEAELNTKLPGSASTSVAVDFPDEQTISIDSNGQVLLNDAPFDAPNDPAMPNLTDTLKRLKQNSDNAQTKLLITISSDPKAPYYRTIDVLNALADAAVDNVTFTVDDGF